MAIAEALRDGMAVWPVVVPLAGAALAMVARGRPRLRRGVMEGAVAVTLVASLLLLRRVAHGEVVVMAFGGWGAPVGITFVADLLAATLAAAAGVVALAVAVFARADIRARRRRAGFDPLFLGMIAAANGALLTGDLFNLYVWFELMLVTALGLLTLDRRPAQVDGALRYAAMSMMGATFMLTGIGLLYGVTGTLDLQALAGALAGNPPSLAVVTAGYLLLAGLLLKAGVFPLFFWLPASYHTAPISVGAALAGLLTKVAFASCLRLLVVVFGVGRADPAIAGLPPLLALLAAATMLVSVLAAIAQVDVRRVLAFHVMGQVAYLVMGLALATSIGVAAATFYTVHTMLLQTGLFLGAGAIARATRGYDLRSAGSLAREHPLFSALFAVLALSIAGIPPFSGFWAKALVIDAALRAGGAWPTALAVVALVTGFLTMYSMSLLWTQAFWRPRQLLGHVPRRIPPAMLAAIALLAACTIGLGLAVGPAVRLSRTAALALETQQPGAARAAQAIPMATTPPASPEPTP